MATSNSRTGQGNVVEHKIFLSKSSEKSYQVMKFNKDVDFKKWREATIQRENNSKLFETEIDEVPEFGEGSEFGRKERKAAKKRKFMETKDVYNPREQPWILKTLEESCREYKSQMVGISDNAAYYVLNQVDGGLEAYPVEDWNTFQRKIQVQKFSIEELEEQFKNRNKYTNFVALLNKMQSNQVDEDENEEGGCKKKKVSDRRSSGESSSEECERGKKKKVRKVKKVVKEKNERGSDDEAFEDSDDGDGEGRELEYISSGDSDSEKEEFAIIGVADEKAMRQALDSDEDDSEEETTMYTKNSQVQLEANSKSLGIQQSSKTNFGSETVSKEDKWKNSKSKDKKSEKAGGKKRKADDDNLRSFSHLYGKEKIKK